MSSHILLSKLPPYVEEINGDYQFKIQPNSYYLSLFHICHKAYEMPNYISCVYNSRKPVMHKGIKCSLISGNGCCHSSCHLLSEDISMTVHNIQIFVLFMRV
jgi:hypothetical protein